MSPNKEIRDERMEFTLRFFAYLENYQQFQHSVREFLDEYMRQYSSKDEENTQSMDNQEIQRMNEEFERVLEFVKTHY